MPVCSKEGVGHGVGDGPGVRVGRDVGLGEAVSVGLSVIVADGSVMIVGSSDAVACTQLDNASINTANTNRFIPTALLR